MNIILYWMRITIVSFIIASVGFFVFYVWCKLCNRKEGAIDEEVFEII